MDYKKTFSTSFARYMNGMAEDICNKPIEYAKNLVMLERALEEQKSLLKALEDDPENSAAAFAITDAIDQERKILPKRIFVKNEPTEKDYVEAGCDGEMPKTTFAPKIVTNYFVCPDLRIKSRNLGDLLYFIGFVAGKSAPGNGINARIRQISRTAETKIYGFTVKVVGEQTYTEAASYKVITGKNSGYKRRVSRPVYDEETGVTYRNANRARLALNVEYYQVYNSARGFDDNTDYAGRFCFVE